MNKKEKLGKKDHAFFEEELPQMSEYLIGYYGFFPSTGQDCLRQPKKKKKEKAVIYVPWIPVLLQCDLS